MTGETFIESKPMRRDPACISEGQNVRCSLDDTAFMFVYGNCSDGAQPAYKAVIWRKSFNQHAPFLTMSASLLCAMTTGE